MSVLSSFIPGRIRLRSSLVADESARAILTDALRALPFVIDLQATPATGSLLIRYRIAELPLERIMASVPLLEELQNLEDWPAGPTRDARLRALATRITSALVS